MDPRPPVIDPSEILIDRTGTLKEDVYFAPPWLRFLARFFDYSLFLLLILGIKTLFHLQGGKYESMVPFEFCFWIPIEAFFLSLFGITPGKFLLKIQLRQGRRKKLDFSTALKRSVAVWFRGLGMMIPIVNVLCMTVAYYRLSTIRWTSWDRDAHITVTSSPIGRWRVVLSAVFTFVAMIFYYRS